MLKMRKFRNKRKIDQSNLFLRKGQQVTEEGISFAMQMKI